MSGWKIFDFDGKTVVPKVTIRKGGQIGLNSAAVRKFKLNEYGFAQLLINVTEQMVGIKPMKDGSGKGAHKMKIIQGGGTISSKNFVTGYGLLDIKKNKLECEWDEENKMIIAKYEK
jgi:hypothetical protein